VVVGWVTAHLQAADVRHRLEDGRLVYAGSVEHHH
jgi:hypothetical protein